MMSILALAIVSVIAVLGLLHLYWSLGGTALIDGTIPEVSGHPVFSPNRALTAVVGAFLILCAALVAAMSGLVSAGAASYVLPWLGYGLAAGLLARSVGDFRLVGFFKRVRGNRFARLDTAVYSPLCLLLAIGIFVLAAHGSGR
jgi:hypothetical protein